MKPHYVVDINSKQIHEEKCPLIVDRENFLNIDEQNDAEIFYEKLGFAACETCQPQIDNRHHILTIA